MNAFYDADSKTYKYTDKDGNIGDLFDSKEAAKSELIETSRLFATTNEYEKYIKNGGKKGGLDKFGEELLGDLYKTTTRLHTAAVNMAKESPYYEVVGGGRAKVIESEGRVKYAKRERAAFGRAIERFRTTKFKTEKGEELSIDEDGLELYRQVEEKLQNTYGPAGLQAQKDLANLTTAIDNRDGSKGLGKKTIELVWGPTTKANQIDISGAIDEFEYDGEQGITQDIYDSSVGGMIDKFIKENKGYSDADIVLNVGSSGANLL